MGTVLDVVTSAAGSLFRRRERLASPGAFHPAVNGGSAAGRYFLPFTSFFAVLMNLPKALSFLRFSTKDIS